MSAQQIKVTIDRQSPVPLYHQLAEQLSHAITVGQPRPGYPCETGSAVPEGPQRSGPRVRPGIRALVARGLLVRCCGVGSTVGNSKAHRRLALTSLYDDL